jgi:hypothetical protein
MKSLDQIEPRTDLANVASDANNRFVIGQPGCYYLTSNITTNKNGIIIHVDGVTLDLNGFALVGDGTAGRSGITSSVAVKNIRILNGMVRGFAAAGIFLNGSSGVLASDLTIRDNGTTGLYLGDESMVTRCVIKGNVTSGLRVASASTVTDCAVTANGGAGITAGNNAVVERCVVGSNTGDGILVAGASVIADCSADANAGTGITCGVSCILRNSTSRASGSQGFNLGQRANVTSCTAAQNGQNGFNSIEALIVNCSATDNQKNGILIQTGLVRGNFCFMNGIGAGVTDGAGIRATGLTRIEDNVCQSNDQGISTATAIVIRNFCSGNTGSGTPSANYDVTGTGVAPIGNANAVTNPFANIVSP